MSRVVLTRKMLGIIREGINDRRTILNDDLSFDPNNKELIEQMKLCDKVTTWAIAVETKRGYHE